MIKRLMIVLCVLAGIVFVPYFLGIWHWGMGAFDAEYDDPLFVKYLGGIGKSLIILLGLMTISIIYAAIEYIINGE